MVNLVDGKLLLSCVVVALECCTLTNTSVNQLIYCSIVITPTISEIYLLYIHTVLLCRSTVVDICLHILVVYFVHVYFFGRLS